MKLSVNFDVDLQKNNQYLLPDFSKGVVEVETKFNELMIASRTTGEEGVVGELVGMMEYEEVIRRLIYQKFTALGFEEISIYNAQPVPEEFVLKIFCEVESHEKIEEIKKSFSNIDIHFFEFF